MPSRPGALIAALFGVGTVAATASAQIVRRDSVPRADAAAVTDSGHRPLLPIDVARAEQKKFEAFRRLHLPHVAPRWNPGCDERVGRMCYWYDESATLPAERDSVRIQRDKLIGSLDSLARIVPHDVWVAGQRVRYLNEAGRNDEALAVARACDSGDWRCGVLVGFALHAKGDYVEAGRVYDAALAGMEPQQRCEWRTIYLLLDGVALAAYRDLPCDDARRTEWEERTWFLARTLYSMPGNDSRTEYFARMTMARLLSDAAVPYQFGFDASERDLLLRFGWARAWAAELMLPFTTSVTPPSIGPAGGIGGGKGGGTGTGPNVGGAKGRGRGGTPVGSLPPGTKVPPNVPPLERPPDMPGTGGLPGTLGGAPDNRPPVMRGPRVEMRLREGDGINVVSMEAVPAYRYIPAGFVLADPTQSDSAAWRLQLPPVMARYAPPYAKTLVPLEHQQAVFKRGDSAIVVMSYQTTGNKPVEGAKIRAALVVTPAGAVPGEHAAVRDDARQSGVLTVRAPWGPLLMSAEVVAPERNAVARARYGVGPLRGPEGRVVLSDLLFYTPYASAPTSVEDVAPYALPTERIRARDKLGVYWEAYGTNPDGEPIKVSLVVAREVPESEGGLLRRLGRSLRLGGAATPVSVTISDVSTRGATTTSRGIEFDVSTLTRGAYIVQLEIEVAGQATLRSEHRIEVIDP